MSTLLDAHYPVRSRIGVSGGEKRRDTGGEGGDEGESATYAGSEGVLQSEACSIAGEYGCGFVGELRGKRVHVRRLRADVIVE